MTLDVPVCRCVETARSLGPVLPVPSKFRMEGDATSSSSAGPTFAWLGVRCDYCNSMLLSVDAYDFSQPIELRESQGERRGD